MPDLLPQLYPPITLDAASPAAAARGMSLHASAHYVDVVHGSRIIRVALRHAHYVYDVVTSFEAYFSAVEPLPQAGMQLVDFSTPRWHDVVGFDLQPICFPSFAEPARTAAEYLTLANLHDGAVVLDLGAYAGLTSIFFDRQVAPAGRVIAVEADTDSIPCLQKNLKLYHQLSGRKIDLLAGAVWRDDHGVEFSVEGNMGAAPTAIAGNQRGQVRQVPSFTLSAIARQFSLPHVDFIKCDIEGAESVIFDDEDFFRHHRPAIVIEPHQVAGQLTTAACRRQLEKLHYTFAAVPQSGVLQYGIAVPLLHCIPGYNP